MSSSTPSTRPARCYALIPCAGSGSRAGTAGPKQYEPLHGQPLVMHTLAAFAAVPRLAATLLVVAPDDAFWRGRAAPVTVRACGGATRAQSVGHGLAALRELGATDDDWALVHDAARCLITPRLIHALIDACEHDAVGGLLAQPLADTLKQAQDGRVAGTLDRANKWLAQTPQMFRLGLLQRALAQAGPAVTDEASAIEALGLQPLLVAADEPNFKVTYPQDLALAEALLQRRTR